VVRGDLLEVLRIHLHPARVDHVLHAVDEIEEAIGVDVAEIAGVQPAVAQRLCGQVGPAVVAEHRRHPVAARDTEAGERVRVTVDIGVELPPVEADLVLAGRAPEHDCRRVMRTLARVARGQRTEGEAVGGDRRFHHLTPAGLPDPRRR
jgi:hypothetical protein